jgi:Lar family restriction alleviation protein
MAESELKKCPFCGHKAQLITKKNYLYDKVMFSVRCTTSMCPGHPPEPVWYDSKEQAIKNWNRRKGAPLD